MNPIETLLNRLGDQARLCYRDAAPYLQGNAHMKPDRSLVTELDLHIERKLRQIIRANFTHHFILGEEFGIDDCDSHKSIPTSNKGWVIDPIDGTANLACGTEWHGTLVAYVEERRPLYGMIEMSALEQRWVASLHSVRMQRQGTTLPCHSSGCTHLADARIACSTPAMFTPSQRQAFDHLAHLSKVVIYGTQCYGYGLLARGDVDLVVESDLNAHDFLAAVPIVQAAGGHISDWYGQALHLNSGAHVLAAATQTLHQQAVAILEPSIAHPS